MTSQVLPALALIVVAVLGAVFLYGAAYDGRVFPGVRAGDVDLGGRSVAEAWQVLLTSDQPLTEGALGLRDGDHTWQFKRRDLGLTVNVDPTLNAAMAVGRTGPVWDRLLQRFHALVVGVDVGRPSVGIDSSKLTSVLDHLSSVIDEGAKDPETTLMGSRSPSVKPSRTGRRMNLGASSRDVMKALPDLHVTTVDLIVDDLHPAVTATNAAWLKSPAELMISAPLTLHTGSRTWTLSRDDIAGVVATSSSAGQTGEVVKVDESRLAPLLARIAREVDTPGTNARFDFKGGTLQAIVPGKNGVRLDERAAIKAIEAQLPTSQRDVQLPLVPSKPAFDSGDAATLAVGDLISTASTTYGDTIPNRRFNVELAASRLNGTVVAPGDVFSLNGTLGEVSYRSGYKQAYGITESPSGVETIPSEGGGICQVATTLFHAVFWAGYPVVERNWHLYWIPRYGLPPTGLKGLDATIDQIYGKDGNLLYSIDFRFKNNTHHPLLIRAHTDGQRIIVSLYGAKPSWQVHVSGPTIKNVVKTDPLPVRQPTSTFAPGHRLMVEEAEDGFTATIVRRIVQDGKEIDAQTFRSVYQPSRNVWLVGASRGSPDAVPGPAIPADRPANVPPISSGTQPKR